MGFTWIVFNAKNGGSTTLTSSVEGARGGFCFTGSEVSLTSSVEGVLATGIAFDSVFESELELEGFLKLRAASSNQVAWSAIGSASLEVTQSNEAGFMPLELPGWIVGLLQLGRNVVAYGLEGIVLLTPYSSPVPTWGQRVLSATVGTAGAYSFAGSLKRHFFLSSNAELWLVEGEPEPVLKNLGFKEHLSVLGTPVLTYDEENERLYLADDLRGFCFDEGLGGGFAGLSGLAAGLAASPSSLVGEAFEVLTQEFDLGHRGLKQLTWVELGLDSSENIEIACDFRYNKAENWRTSSWKPVNFSGAGFLGVSGVEFRLRVRQTSFEPVRLDYFNVRYRNTDKRFLRGPL